MKRLYLYITLEPNRPVPAQIICEKKHCLQFNLGRPTFLFLNLRKRHLAARHCKSLLAFLPGMGLTRVLKYKVRQILLEEKVPQDSYTWLPCHP